MTSVSTPSCSVAVCTRDRPEQLRRCLESVARVDYPSLDIIVVDNAPSDRAAAAVAHEAAARYVIEPRVGLSFARNRAVENSRADVVAFLDDDSLADPHWIRNLLRHFVDPAVAVVTGRIVPLKVATAAQQLCASLAWLDAGAAPLSVTAELPDYFECVNVQGIGFGGNMALRRSAIAGRFPFDTRFGRGSLISSGEENYLFLQLLSHGFRIDYEPTAIVHHPYPESMDHLRSAALDSHAATTAFYLLLLSEHPEYRRDVFHHLTTRAVNGMMSRSFTPLNSRMQVTMARARGILTYIKTLSFSRMSAQSRSLSRDYDRKRQQ